MNQEQVKLDTRNERTFADRATLARTLSRDIERWLTSTLASRPRASLVFSGGSTPVPLFHALRETSLPWSQMDLTLADERWVPGDHKDSNDRLLQEELLQGPVQSARYVSLKTPAETPDDGLAECEARLKQMSRPFDVVILGMGSDGHTASLFPHTPTLEKGLDPQYEASCIACYPETAPHARISMTLSALLNAQRIVLHITGDEKWQVYQDACNGTDVNEMPIRAILQQDQVEVDVYWAP